MSAAAIEEAAVLLQGQFEVAGVGVAGYDPAFDADGRVVRGACRILSSLLGRAHLSSHGDSGRASNLQDP
jgi:hypothetical protein